MASVRIGIGVDNKTLQRDLKQIEKEIKSTQRELDKLNQAPKKSETLKNLEKDLEKVLRKAEKAKEGIDKLNDKESRINKNFDNGAYKTDASAAKAKSELEVIPEQKSRLNEQIGFYQNQFKDIQESINQLELEENSIREESIQLLEQQLADLEKEKEDAEGNVNLIEKACSALGKISGLGILKKTGQMAANLFKSATATKNISDGMQSVSKKAMTFVGALIGARSLYSLISKAINQIKDQNKELADTLNSLWNGLIQLITPFVNSIVNALTTALNYVIKMVSIITGANILGIIKKGNQKANAKAGGGSKKQGALASFDTSEVLHKNDGSGAGTTTEGYLKDIELNEDLLALAERLHKMWEKIVKVINNITDGIKEGLEYMNSGERIVQVMKDLFNAILDDIDAALDATVEWSDALDFGPFFDSVASTLEELEPILEAVGDLFLWLYTECILPLVEWLLEEAIPAFNNMLVPILETINACIEKVKPILSALWETTLKPLFEFIGEQISGVLTDVGKWFEDNQGWIADLAEALGTVLSYIAQIMMPFLASFFKYIRDTVNTVLKFISDIVEDMKQIFSDLIEFISAVFAGDWEAAWKSLLNIFIDIWASIVDTMEMGVNGIVNAINWVINGVNGISFDLPWFMGGGHVGFSLATLSQVSLSSWKIPRLAEGAVIPPNHEFLALLGDQTRGRNIEAPESLLREIVGEESGEQVININASGDIGQLIRFLHFELNKEDDRVGQSLVVG